MPDDEKLLRPVEILRQIPDLKREVLLRWTRQGYVHNKPENLAGRTAYLYPESEIARLRSVAELVREGYAPRKAFEKVGQDTNYADRLLRAGAQLQQLKGQIKGLQDEASDHFQERVFNGPGLDGVPRLVTRYREDIERLGRDYSGSGFAGPLLRQMSESCDYIMKAYEAFHGKQ